MSEGTQNKNIYITALIIRYKYTVTLDRSVGHGRPSDGIETRRSEVSVQTSHRNDRYQLHILGSFNVPQTPHPDCANRMKGRYDFAS